MTQMTKDLFLSILEKGSIYTEVNPRRTDLPAHLGEMQTVWLQWGLNMAKPISDLEVTHQGVSGTLSFNGSPCWVMVFWVDVLQFALGPDHADRKVPQKPTHHNTRVIPKGWRVLQGGKGL